SVCVGTICAWPPWVRISRPSRASWKPPSASSTVTAFQKRFMARAPPFTGKPGGHDEHNEQTRREEQVADPRLPADRALGGKQAQDREHDAADPRRLDRKPAIARLPFVGGIRHRAGLRDA